MVAIKPNIPLEDFFVCDLDSNIWTKIEAPNGPAARYYHSGVVCNNKLYIFGGAKTNKIYYNDLHTFDFETNTWSLIELEAESVPSPRAGQVIFILNNKLFLYGGFGEDGGYLYFTDMFSLNLENPVKWDLVEKQEGSTLPCTGRPLSGVVMDNKFYIFGGYDGKVPQGKLICFNPQYNLWSPIALAFAIAENTLSSVPMASSQWFDPTPRYGHACVINKKLITIFGGSGSLFLGDVFQIDTEV